jgi:hypothetical protein
VRHQVERTGESDLDGYARKAFDGVPASALMTEGGLRSDDRQENKGL